ncbi:MAG: 16S rRNA processing protein RimM [Acidimicrobiales bacterium]|nr:16S rRNA processing protein RimM [Acidimicrobiales bacterium]
MTLLEVGRVAKAHGLRGEVIVALSTDRTERLDPGTVLFSDDGELTVVTAQPHQRRWIVQFAGVESREAAEALHGLVLRAEPLDDPDALFVHELIGSEVVDETGAMLGTVESVEQNPASNLLVLDGGALIPVRFITARGGDRLVVDVPAGLLEL